jgi:non-ribosomal peptide synthase protein (TIGR01720 family)
MLISLNLTAAKFISDPFCPDSNNRLYHTGDLARFLPDGNIEFLGRIDHQVKVRGFRIELGEIDTVLNQHPSVQDALVLVREDTPGDKRLAAYVVLDPEMQDPSNDLRNFLRQKLPEYMIPAAFVLLPALPLTANGKVDRRALPAPDLGRQDRQIIAPHNLIEETLVNIWSQVLNIETIGIHDNFFELGGDSILSIQVISRAQQCGIQLTPKQLFQFQTIAELATVAGAGPEIQAEQGLVMGAVPLTPIQHWFFQQELPERHQWNQSVLLQMRQPLEPTLLEKTIQHLLLHHDALRLRFEEKESGWQQIHENWVGDVPCSVVDLSALTISEQESTIIQTTSQLQTSLNISEGPLLRVAYFKLGSQPDRLFWVIHHLVVDGVSWRVLLEDMHLAYQQLQKNEVVQLPLKSTSFQMWSQKLTEYAQSAALWNNFQDWLATTWSATMHLPTDRANGANTEASACKVSLTLNTEETRALLQKVPKAYRTKIDEVLLTALVKTLTPWLNSRTVLIDLESHDRESLNLDVDLSRTIGWFTAMFPVLLDLGPSDLLSDQIKSIKEQLRHLPQKGLSYGLLRFLSIDPDICETLQALPKAEISFNYFEQLDLGSSEQLLFQLDPANSIEVVRNPQGNRTHLLEISAYLVSGQLQVEWIYSENLHQQETIERLAKALMQALLSLIDHCQSPEVGGYTPSDFSLTKLDQSTLDAVLQVEQDVEEIYPLTPMQENMLLHRLHAPETGLNVVHQVFPLRGVVLNQSLFERAWQQVVNAHPILRTSFFWKNLQEPLQIVHKKAKLPLQYENWRHLSARQQTARLETYIQSIRTQNFDLTQVPQLQISLFQIANDAYHFVWIYNYMLLDGWSSAFLMKEFFDCHEAYSKGHSLQLESKHSYKDYIAWLHQQDFLKAKTFWKHMLKGLKTPTTLELQPVSRTLVERDTPSQSIDTDPETELRALLIKQQQLNHLNPGTLMRRAQTLMTPTPRKLPVQEDDYVQQLGVLSEATTNTLRELAKQQQVTLNTIVQSAWAISLSHYSTESEVVFGVTVSGRPATLDGIESIVGLLINTLPLRLKVPPQAPFLNWLKELQEQQVELSQYEYSSPAQIKSWSDIPGDLPLFKSCLVFENAPVSTAVQDRVKNWGIDFVRSLAQTEHLLRVEVFPGPMLLLSLSYYQHYFETAKVISILGYFQGVLEAIAANSNQDLATLMQQALSGRKTFLQKLLAHARLQKKKEQVRHLKKSLLLSLLAGSLLGGFFFATHRKETPLHASPKTKEHAHTSLRHRL